MASGGWRTDRVAQRQDRMRCNTANQPVGARGQVFSKELWAAACPPRLHYAYGFYCGRRREHSILVLNAVRWKLRQLGLGHNTTFHDVANAFPSTTHDTLDAMIHECAPPEDHALLKCRYGNTQVIINGHGDKELVVRPRLG